MNRVRLKKVIRIEDLPFTPPVITKDGLDRTEKLEYTYLSIKVTYTAEWNGTSNNLVTYNQVILDI